MPRPSGLKAVVQKSLKQTDCLITSIMNSDHCNLCSNIVSVICVCACLYRLDAFNCKRVNVGGSHAAAYMQRLLQLKYPAHQAAITLSRMEELLHHHCYVAADYQQGKIHICTPACASTPCIIARFGLFFSFGDHITVPLNEELSCGFLHGVCNKKLTFSFLPEMVEKLCGLYFI